MSVRDHAGLVAVFAFCLGAWMYYHLFFRSRLIPRWLPGLAIDAIIPMMTACVLALFIWIPTRLAVGLMKPRNILGMVLAVEAEAAGKSVRRFRIAGRAYAFTIAGMRFWRLC